VKPTPTAVRVTMNHLAMWMAVQDDSSMERSRCRRSDDVVADILNVLLASRFRKGSLQSMRNSEFIEHHLGLVANRVRQDLPLQLTLIGFPFKVPNPLKVGGRILPDLAEMAAVRMLSTMRKAVCSVYPPGLEIIIIHDGSYIAGALEVPINDVRLYTEYFSNLLRLMGADVFIRSVDLTELMRVHPPVSQEITYALDAYERRTTERDLALRKTLGMMNLRDVSTNCLVSLTSEDPENRSTVRAQLGETLYRRAGRALSRYEILDALLHCSDPRPHAFPDAIHATTKSQPGRLAIWLVRRGRGVLPWHGVGALEANGRLGVGYVIDIEGSGRYQPVFLEGESTPFLYADADLRPSWMSTGAEGSEDHLTERKRVRSNPEES
jgi:hypothetical protein